MGEISSLLRHKPSICLPDPNFPDEPKLVEKKCLKPAADPNRYDIANLNSLKGLFGEEALANIVHSLEDEYVVLWGKKAGTHGADVVSVNLKTGEVTLWDAKWRTNPTKIIQSPTFSKGPNRMNAIEEALDVIANDASLPLDIQSKALMNLEQKRIRAITAGMGPGSLNSEIQYFQ